MKRLIYTLSCFILFSTAFPWVNAQSLFKEWNKEVVPFDQRSIFEPSEYQAYEVDESLLLHSLQNSLETGKLLALPLPGGTVGKFAVLPFKVAADDFYKAFPSITTFRLEQVDGPHKGLGDFSPKGFHASLYGPAGLIYIDPTHSEPDQRAYAVYYIEDYSRGEDQPEFICGTNELMDNTQFNTGDEIDERKAQLRSAQADSVPFRTYRMVATTTAEYSNFHGGSKASVAAALATLLTRVNEVMMREFSIKYELIEGTDTLFFFDSATDPYTNGNTGAMIGEGAATIPQYIGPSQYDIGHVFCTNAGGLASVSSVCLSSKTRGVSCGTPPINDSYYIRVVSHELGHQMGSRHSFNFCGGQNETLSKGYEPGSGSTIMSYAGLCGSRNVQSFTSPYYNIGSVESIVGYMHEGPGKNCAQTQQQGNTKPIVTLDYEDGFYIPISTPFELHASATDAETEELYYCWEQRNAGFVNCEPGSPSGSCPLFRSIPPTRDSFRIFPELRDVVLGVSDKFEVLPTYSRSLMFACTVRDWEPEGGALAWDFVQFDATEEAGPFTVDPVSGRYEVGDQIEITWDVANTDQPPVNCEFVDIYMSTNNGQSFSHLLAKEVPNIGNITLNLPNLPTNLGKIKVKASNNIFFNISSSTFIIEQASEPGFIASVSPYAQQVCLPAAASLQIFTESYLGFTEMIEIIDVEGLPAGSEFTVSPENIEPGEIFNISINFKNAPEGTYPISFNMSGGEDTTRVSLQATLVSNDFSALKGTLPLTNAENVSELPTFKWDTVQDADQYIVQVADNPNFDSVNLLYTSELIEIDSHTVKDLLPKNSLLYWRIIPVNECGMGTPSPVRVFHTEAQTCELYESDDVPLTIPTSGSAEVISVMDISNSGVIADVNVLNLRGQHSYIGELIAHLESPAGTEVKLFDTDCFNFQNFAVSFDDQASTSISCPLNSNRTHRPRGSLASLNGENTQGTWQIRLNDNTPGSGGQLQGWSLEICGSISVEKPEFRSDTVYVKKGQDQFIKPENLLAEKSGIPDYQLLYTVVEAPGSGVINYSGPLKAGSIFNQDAVNNYWLVYEHNGSEDSVDFMSFTIEDQVGGWIGLDTLYFVVDSALSTDQRSTIEFQVFPNPTQDRFTVNIPDAGNSGSIQVINSMGQMIMERKMNGRIQYHFDCTGFPQGMYFVRVIHDQAKRTEKIIIQ